jgi:hypothetical protein
LLEIYIKSSDDRFRCLFRQTSKQHDGYVSPGSWPPIRETYESSIEDLHFDYEVTLQVGATTLLKLSL